MLPIIEVPVDAAELFEQLGTKEKFWYADEQRRRWLFKRGRPGTGENWAEKLACELASALGIPHAYYELARCGDDYGVVSPSFVPRGGRLVHGNEIFSKTRLYQEMAHANPYRSRAHTIRLFAAFLKLCSEESKDFLPPSDFVSFEHVASIADVMVGYLMLDAWIGNQDRHDQNWGLLIDPAVAEKLFLAPSFDHGSSFGRNLTDEVCGELLTTRDMQRHISAFVAKARSGLYPGDATLRSKSLLTTEAFVYLAKMWPDAARAWLDRLRAIGTRQIASTVSLLPDEFVTAVRRDFLVTFLTLNRQRLLALESGL
ncbi:hypothetical protein [Paraburkholderia sp. SUR17]|uniref:hypothetical protein n=1 Tax=Paraburkholderia sp. SUR17 TaxID=3034358 RepID=UPI002407B2D4|nr:hypothetical protein [Paraburkholderia sp. SUR17]WEY38822.1 hypothetical protein P2869_00085 [Paraburkholderia sp. SUR17]